MSASFVRAATIVGLVALPGIGPSPAANAAEATRPPNILFIMADDVGCEPLGCYGGTSYRTPHLDRLAADGMRFRYAFSMPVCHPTRVCLLTGRYPFRLGEPGWGSFPKSEEKNTFAWMMKRAGYATAIAGKWQLILMKRNPQHPQQLGFDDSCLFGWHEGPRYYDPYLWQNGRLRDDTKGRYGPDVYCEFLIDFIQRNKDRPFLAYYSMALCHAVTDDLKEPVPFGPHGRYDNYQEMIEAMDVRVGRLVAALDRLGLRENTLILFTGDNGTPKSNIATVKDGKLVREPVVSRVGDKEVRGGKGSLTDAGTNVPLIANWKGTIEAGQVVDDLVDFSDLLPTFAELGGAKPPQGVQLDGQSFAPRLLGKPGPARKWAYAESGDRFWVRTQRWKLYSDGRLFDMKGDPQEKHPRPITQPPPRAEETIRMLHSAVKQLQADRG